MSHPPSNVLLRLALRYATVFTAIHVFMRPIVRKLPHIHPKVRGDWLNRVVASLHHGIVSLASIRALCVEEPFSSFLSARIAGGAGSVNYFAGHSRTLDHILPISLGYFSYDTILLLVVDRQLSTPLMILHHIGCLVSWPVAYLTDTHHAFLLYLLATEVSGPFLHQAVFFLPKAGKVGTPIHTFCGVMLILTFFLVRVCPVPLLIWAIIDALEHLYALPSFLQWMTAVTFPIPAILNLFWFSQIIWAACSGDTEKASAAAAMRVNMKSSKVRRAPPP